MTDQVTSGLPNRDAEAIDKTGKLTKVWFDFMVFLASLTAKELQQITVGASPYVWEATSIGHFHVAAGAVSSVVLQRGGISLPCPAAGFVPVAAGDIVTVTYTVPPAVYFVPAPRT